ncbi:ribonuclease HII [Aquibacillus albus]|uniref:Ribonuclease HII n=1 Tax=Aquibacillus albus TaxID=1168171 RepID=A0ABS2N0Y9_9BACI|nr:ribonuclease HII [Aquibacillus albus]MBM7571804.1 ribonuclease HII [Aquibacillus albus]
MKQTIATISDRLFRDEFSKEELVQLKQDKRVGIQRLLKKYERKLEREQMQRQHFEQMMTFENFQYDLGKQMVAGLDEVGRGPLAGPVVAAAVVLPADFYLGGLNDSKQLSKQTREAYFEEITQRAITYGVGVIHNQEIDRMNIYEATKKAMKKAIQLLSPIPDHVLIDAMKLDDLPCTSESITKGDQKSVSIAAASIIAKVTRDRMMEELHQTYPHYNFASNVGYGTKEHLEAVERHGICPYHRQSFEPIQSFVK